MMAPIAEGAAIVRFGAVVPMTGIEFDGDGPCHQSFRYQLAPELLVADAPRNDVGMPPFTRVSAGVPVPVVKCRAFK